jgi:hypothetical protein
MSQIEAADFVLGSRAVHRVSYGAKQLAGPGMSGCSGHRGTGMRPSLFCVRLSRAAWITSTRAT